MNKPIDFHALRERSGAFLFVLLIGLVGAIAFNFLVERSFRYTIYVFFVPPLAWLLFALKSSLIKVSLAAFSVMFLDAIFMVSGPMDFFRFRFSLVVACVVLASLWYYRPKRLKQHTLKRLFFWFLCTAFLSMCVGIIDDPASVATNVTAFQLYYLEFFLFFLIGLSAFERVTDLKLFLLILVFLGGAAAAIQLYGILFNVQVTALRGVEDAQLWRMTPWGKDFIARRYGGPLGNPNTMSAFLVMLIPMAALTFLYETRWHARLILAGSLVLMPLSLIFGASRSGILLAPANLLFGLFLFGKQRRVVFVVIALCVLGLLAYLLLITYFSEWFQFTVDRFTRLGLEAPGRKNVRLYFVPMLFSRPLGIGLAVSNFMDQILRYGTIPLGNAHNMYIQVALANGVAGIFIFLRILGKIFFGNLRAYRMAEDLSVKHCFACLSVGISGVLLMGLTQSVFGGLSSSRVLRILGLLLGLSATLIVQELQRKARASS